MDYRDYIRKKMELKSQNKDDEFTDEEKSSDKCRTFKDLDFLIRSGAKEIVLESDIILNDDEVEEYHSGIKIDVDDLIIDGNGFTIDAKGKAGIFYCSGNNITIRNLKLTNGYGYYGGAIYHYGGLLTIEKSKFYENTTDEDGGAIYSIGDELIIIESAFTGNVSKGRYGGGGAISISQGNKCRIEKSSLKKNIAQGLYSSGGAILNVGVELSISRSVINENAVKPEGKETPESDFISKNTLSSLNYRGGAIYNAGKLHISKTMIDGNFALNGGGAIYSSGEMTVTLSALNNNISDYGGAVYHSSNHFIISQTEISNNISENSIIFNTEFMKISDVKFLNNQSRNVIDNECDKFNIDISDAEFVGNSVRKTVIYNNGKSCNIEKSIFEKNCLRENSCNIINNTDLTLTNVSIRNDEISIMNEGHILILQSPNIKGKITGKGTVEDDEIQTGQGFDFGYLDKLIHESRTKEIVLNEDITFENYEKIFYENGIELNIDNLVIDGNGKSIDGRGKSRIFRITGKNIILKNITFINGYSKENYLNPSNDSGGAIKIKNSCNLTVENCTFLNNMSEKNGGAIENNGELNIISSKFSNNATGFKGGAIFNCGFLNITDCEFLSNQTNKLEGYGGAIYNKKGDLRVIDSSFNKNTSMQCGGAIYAEKSNSSIITSTFTSNVTKGRHGSGGAIYNIKSVLHISNTRFMQNISGHMGGAITNGGNMKICESSFIANYASGGGAITNSGKSNISKSIFNMNKAYDKGGAIYHRWGELTVNNSKLTENEAHYSGAIENYEGTLIVRKSAIIKNTAHNDGGAIRNVTGNLYVYYSVFNRNAAKWGGSIYSTGDRYSNEKLVISNSIFTENTAEENGGAIYNGGQLWIVQSTLTGNTSQEINGAIYNTGFEKIFYQSGCIIGKNSADFE